MPKFVPVFVATLFISVHYGAILYTNSSLLSNFFGPNVVSTIFLLGACGSIIFFLFAPKLVRLFGKRFLLLSSLMLTFISTLGLAYFNSTFIVAVSFMIYATFLGIIYYCLDIYLEELSTNAKTGEIRGIYLTFISVGVAMGPFILSFLDIVNNKFRPVYIVAAILLLPPILLAVIFFKPLFPKAHGRYHHSPRLPFIAWWRAKNVRAITLIRLTLETFYGLMIVYTPIYLHGKLGFEWSELGIIFSVMLLPFILLEWPSGELSDRLWGEKELMSAGFIVTCVSLLVMPFIGKIFWAWMAILFLSRVGASVIETMTESYFFKQVKASDTGLLSIFRLARPFGSIFGVATGALALNLFSFEKMFLLLAVIILFGLKESLTLKDTL